jgi:hypothetical protein
LIPLFFNVLSHSRVIPYFLQAQESSTQHLPFGRPRGESIDITAGSAFIVLRIISSSVFTKSKKAFSPSSVQKPESLFSEPDKSIPTTLVLQR